MKKSVLLISLLSGTALALSDAAVASGIYATHTRTPRPEPVSFADMAHAYKTASVCFLGTDNCGDAGFDSGNGDYKIDTEQQCKNEGFVRLNCSSLQEIDGACPYNTAYGKSCKCVETLISCPTPQIGSGESCEGKYVSCKCPAGVDEGQYGCKEYYAAPCETVCKKAYADNCHNRTDNNSQTYGCMKYYDDCSTKCETPYKDNCRNRTAVSAPYGCRQYWADCADKCQTAAEEPVCGIGTIYYADGSCAVPEKHDASKTALGVVVHVTDDGKHGQIMAPWPVNASGNKSNAPVDLHWAEGSAMDTDIPALKNYDENGTERLTDYNSCENTDIITATGSASVYPAAWAARKYAPTTGTKGKWCLPSSGVAVNIYNNRQKIQAAISALGGVAYPDCCCWTSTEYATEYDLGYYVGTSSFRIENGLGRGGKGGYNYAYVYPVLAF